MMWLSKQRHILTEFVLFILMRTRLPLLLLLAFFFLLATAGAARNILELADPSVRLTKSSILEHCNVVSETEREVRNFDGPTLAYVTPWNFGGYEFVSKFCKKIDYVVPVWYHIFPARKSFKYNIEGRQNILGPWMEGVKECNPKIKIIPRFLFDQWKPEDFQNLVGSEDAVISLAKGLMAELEENPEYDGLVLETGVPQYLKGALELVIKIIRANWRKDAVLVLPISPPRPQGGKAWDFDLLSEFAPFVNFFSVMTYDYSEENPTRPTPVAPIKWIESILVDSLGVSRNKEIAAKVLMGLNFYGYRYIDTAYHHPEAITGNTLLDVLGKLNVVIKWKGAEGEHLFTYDDEPRAQFGQMAFPSLQSIKIRLDLAKSLGVGVAIWEVGQGLTFWGALF